MPLHPTTQKAIHALARANILDDIAPPVTCENCGRQLATHADGLNFAVAIYVGVPGHGAIPGVTCPEPEHWTCSIECWSKVAHRCIDEHVTPMLQQAHDRVARQTPVDMRQRG